VEVAPSARVSVRRDVPRHLPQVQGKPAAGILGILGGEGDFA
jgi:hypothetical protein